MMAWELQADIHEHRRVELTPACLNNSNGKTIVARMVSTSDQVRGKPDAPHGQARGPVPTQKRGNQTPSPHRGRGLG